MSFSPWVYNEEVGGAWGEVEWFEGFVASLKWGFTL